LDSVQMSSGWYFDSALNEIIFFPVALNNGRIVDISYEELGECSL